MIKEETLEEQRVPGSEGSGTVDHYQYKSGKCTGHASKGPSFMSKLSVQPLRWIYMGVDLNSFIQDPSFLAKKYVNQIVAFLRFIFRRSMLYLCWPYMLYDGYIFVNCFSSFSVLADTK